MRGRGNQIRSEVHKRWPNLFQFLCGYLHEDWNVFHDTPELAVDAAIKDWRETNLQAVKREWSDWKGRVADVSDPRSSLNDGLGVNIWFKTQNDAREFIAMIDEKLGFGSGSRDEEE